MQVGGTDSGLGFSSDHENFISHVLSEAKLEGPNRRRLWGPAWVGAGLMVWTLWKYPLTPCPEVTEETTGNLLR